MEGETEGRQKGRKEGKGGRGGAEGKGGGRGCCASPVPLPSLCACEVGGSEGLVEAVSLSPSSSVDLRGLFPHRQRRDEEAVPRLWQSSTDLPFAFPPSLLLSLSLPFPSPFRSATASPLPLSSTCDRLY